MTSVQKMTSRTLLPSRLLSLLKNGQWERDDVVKFFIALLEQFNDRKEDFDTWIMKILYTVEINKIKATDLTGDDWDHVEAKMIDIIKNKNQIKTLDEILKEICEQTNIDKQVVADVKDIVSSVSKSLDGSFSSTSQLQGIKQTLLKLCQAVIKTKNITPRLTQMVTWCFLVLSKTSQLVQVGTGEGKSCIVAMFAAYQVLQGKTPDIISSSPVLAQRDAVEWSDFYKELQIAVDVNTNKSTDSELKNCYQSRVVYGTAESFAADYLKQSFHRIDVRPERKFDCVIVDEVDSLMLDKGLEVVYLNTEVPHMEHLNRILAEIWYTVSRLKRLDTGEIVGPIQQFSQILIDNFNIDQVSIVQLTAGILPRTLSVQKEENVKNILNQLDSVDVNRMGEFLTMFVKKFPEYVFKVYVQGPDGSVQKTIEISSSATNTRLEISFLFLGPGQCRFLNVEEDLISSLVRKFKKTYLPGKKLNVSCIPGLPDLIDGKLQTWIENAFEATKRTLGTEYVLHGDGVVPVDYRCTGVVQNNLIWGEGLQQFLEMKHQTKLSNMSLITNFLSNVGFFKKYKNQIYGITGTLGDQTELDMLKELYNGMKTCKIPSFRSRKLYELEGLVLPEEKEWVQMVCKVITEQVSSAVYRGPRAVLVICETINRAEVLHKALVKTNLKGKLKLYVNNNMDNSRVVNEPVHESDVIIATNLAGRGTDLKVCESVQKAGGLFVLQTFLPLNVRVERQAFGRTARQGSPGSAQLIMCHGHFPKTVKLISTFDTSLSSCLEGLEAISSVTERVFERAVKCYRENPSAEHLTTLIFALTALLTLNSFGFKKNHCDQAKNARNIVVNYRLSSFLEEDIPNITKKEELFSHYLHVLDIIYKNNSSEQCDVIISSLHESWGLWLLLNFSEEKSIDTLKEQLMLDLCSAMKQLSSKQTPSSMVNYYVRSGHKLRHIGHLAESIEMYTKASDESHDEDFIPHYNRALATIAKKDAGYISRALADLEKAYKAIASYKLYLSSILMFVKSSQKPQREEHTLLAKEFQVKSMVLHFLEVNIQDAVMRLRRAQRTGRDVRLTTKPVFFLIGNITVSNIELLRELMNFISLGLDTVFTLDTFNFILSKLFG